MSKDSSIGGNRAKVPAIVSLVLFIGVLAANWAATSLPLNGVSTGALSDELPNLFVPAGLTFSIWGLIYVLLTGQTIAILMLAFGRKNAATDAPARWSSRDGWLLALNFAANIGWIFAWQWRLVGLALGIMLVLLATLIILEEGTRGRKTAGIGASAPSPALRFFLTAPVNVYLGWIMVATIANVTALLVKLGWNGFGLDPRAWTIIVIAVAAILYVLLAFLRGAVAAPAVGVWAFAGIALKRLQVDADYSRPVWMAAIVAAAAVAASVVAARMIRRRKA
jgi:hypothetical protein